MRAALPGSSDYSYPNIPDHVDRPNDNAYVLTTMCMDLKLVVINNLKFREKEFASRMTYKQGNTWISELDVCMASSNMIDYVIFIIVQ